MYLRNCLLFLSRLLYIKHNGHPFWEAFKENIEVFSTEDLENMHSQLSLLMSRMSDKSNDKAIQERWRLLGETRGIEQRVNNIYRTNEQRPDKRRSGKVIPKDSPEVNKAYAYIFDVLSLLEEHNSTTQEQIADLNNGMIETIEDLECFGIQDQLYCIHHPLAPVPITSGQVPLANIAEYVRYDIANLASWVTGTQSMTCGCQSGCSTNNCRCRSSQISCGHACKCEKLMCINKL